MQVTLSLSNLVAWASTPIGAAILYWFFSTVVGQMPKPNGNVWYAWLYNTLQYIAANHTLPVLPIPKPSNGNVPSVAPKAGA